ncbi:hypothetical protein D3C77_523840 [compost metagenome]
MSIAVLINAIADLAAVTEVKLIALIPNAVVPFLDSFTVNVSELETPIWKSTAAVVLSKLTPLNLELSVMRLISDSSSLTSN